MLNERMINLAFIGKSFVRLCHVDVKLSGREFGIDNVSLGLL